MNIFRQELKVNRKALIIWSVCMFLLVVIGMAKYSSYSSDGQSINSVMANMPYSLKALFGMGSFDLSTVKGYFAVLFGYLELQLHFMLFIGHGYYSQGRKRQDHGIFNGQTGFKDYGHHSKTICSHCKCYHFKSCFSRFIPCHCGSL